MNDSQYFDKGNVNEIGLDTMSVDSKMQNSIKIPLPSIAAHSRPHLRDFITMSEIQTAPSNCSILTNEPLIVDPKSEPTPSLNPRHAKLQASIIALEAQITATGTKLSQTLDALRGTPIIRQSVGHDAVSDEAILEQAQAIVTKHIKLLHQYNEIKDVGLGLVGLIAEKEGKRLGEVMEERGVDSRD